MYKYYSKINQIPKGHASMNITKGCVICEGGAFRAVYGEGVLDALMENDINMECTIGVSAGALNGYNYVAGQIGRSARFNLYHRFDPNYIGGPKTLIHNKGIIGFDYAFGPNRIEPFDQIFFDRPSRRFVAVATNCLTGESCYFEKGKCEDIEKAIQASASLPFVSSMVEIQGIPCLDGGISNHIPIQWALNEGYLKIIVIRTQHKVYRKEDNEKMDSMIDLRYSKYPELRQSLKNMNKEYTYTCDFIDQLEKEGKIFVFSPSINDPVSRLEADVEKLGDWYFLGYNDTNRRMKECKEYLEK